MKITLISTCSKKVKKINDVHIFVIKYARIRKSKASELIVPTLFAKGGRLALIIGTPEKDYNSDKGCNKNNVPPFSPIYNAMYKVWESMAEDNIITEVK